MTEIRLNRPLRLLAPAKINLGLEIIGRRADGYHEIVTILQAVDLYDELVLTPAETLIYTGDPRIPEHDDLLLSALRVAGNRFGFTLHARIQLNKRIPISAGLGGGSSNAGTILAALGALADIPHEELLGLAAELGSDIPFFIRGGTSLATGTGTNLETLPSRAQIWFVVVTPDVQIRNKTASLYARLRPADFSDGRVTREVAKQLHETNTFDPWLLRNAFARPLHEHLSILQVRDAMQDAGATIILPSGAGPSLFSPFDTVEAANEVAIRLSAQGVTASVRTAIGPGINDEPLDAAREYGTLR